MFVSFLKAKICLLVHSHIPGTQHTDRHKTKQHTKLWKTNRLQGKVLPSPSWRCGNGGSAWLGDLNTAARLPLDSRALLPKQLPDTLPPRSDQSPVAADPRNCAFCSPGAAHPLPAAHHVAQALARLHAEEAAVLGDGAAGWRAVSSTVARRLDAQPPGPPGSRTEKVRRGSGARVR